MVGASALIIFICLSIFLVYVTWAALQGKHYTFGPYLSPSFTGAFWRFNP